MLCLHRACYLLVAGSFVSWALACGPDPRSAPESETLAERPERSQSPASPNVSNCLIIVLDAVPIHHFSFYGEQERETTPYIDRLARDSFVFMATHSQETNTLPSAYSYMSGRYPPAPRRKFGKLVLAETTQTLAEAFREAGFRTALFSENPFLSPVTGFDQGFEKFEMLDVVAEDENASGKRHDPTRRIPSTTRAMIEQQKAWIESLAGERWFGYMHVLRPHNPYVAPDPYLSRYVDPGAPPSGASPIHFEHELLSAYLYDKVLPDEEAVRYLEGLFHGNLSYIDALVGEFMAWLEERDILDDTLVVLISDHGEQFMEHGLLLHGGALFEEAVHVPMIIRLSESSGGRRGRSDLPTELVDLYPTLVELFELAPPPQLHGRSLLPLLLGNEELAERPTYSQTSYGHSVSVRLGQRKLIVELDDSRASIVGYQLYDLAVDPEERSDIFDSIEKAEPLVTLARRFVTSYLVPDTPLPEAALSEKDLRALEALGYIE
jgi:arylsulfatase A-like enzyme